MRWYALSNRPWVEEDPGSPASAGAGESGTGGSGYWGLPPGSIGSVDLAPVGGRSHVFVTSDAPFDPADVAAAIGDGARLDSYVPTPAEAAAWETLVGVTVQPGWTLLDALWATLTSEADPDGVTRAKPIMPTHKGVLELHLGGHSLVRSEKLPADPTTHPAWPNIQRVLQNDYRAIQGRDRVVARKWLGAQQGKYRLSPERARDLIVPADLPRVLPLRPTTTLTESFNKADGALGPDLTWTHIAGGHEVVSNRARTQFANSNVAQAQHDLSSADHYAQFEIYPLAGSCDNAPACRVQSGPTAYVAPARNTPATDKKLFRVLSGAFTQLGSTVAGGPSAGDVVKCKADGSSISLVYNGSTIIGPITDTGITGGLRAGLFGWNSGKGDVDNFEAADLVAEPELVRVRSEAVGIGEAFRQTRGRTKAHDDGLGIGQAVQRLRDVARSRGETMALADMSTVARALSRLRIETAGIFETTAFVVQTLAEALVRVLAEAVAMAEAVARPRRLTRVRAELVGMADAVARVGGAVSTAVPIIANRIRIRIGAASRLSAGPSARMNVPPARR